MGLRYAHKVPPLNVKKHKSLMELVVELMVELELILMVVLMKMFVLSITAHKKNHAFMMQ